MGVTLAKNESLIELDLSSSRISSRGAKGIADGLLDNCNLQILRVKGNMIKPDGVQDLLEACLKNPISSMRELDLGKTNISAENYSMIQKLEVIKPDLLITVGTCMTTKLKMQRLSLLFIDQNPFPLTNVEFPSFPSYTYYPMNFTVIDLYHPSKSIIP